MKLKLIGALIVIFAVGFGVGFVNTFIDARVKKYEVSVANRVVGEYLKDMRLRCDKKDCKNDGKSLSLVEAKLALYTLQNEMDSMRATLSTLHNMSEPYDFRP